MMDFCGSSTCSNQDVLSCALKQILDSSTCMNHVVVIGVGALLGLVLAMQLLVKISRSGASAWQLFTLSSPLLLAAVVFNVCLGLVFLFLGLCMLGNIFNQDASGYLPHWWLVTLSQGFMLSLTSFAFSMRPRFLGAIFIRIWSVLVIIYATFICYSSVVDIVAENTINIKGCLDVLSLPGAVLLLLYGIQCKHDEEGFKGVGDALYEPLKTEADGSESQVTRDRMIDSSPYVSSIALGKKKKEEIYILLESILLFGDLKKTTVPPSDSESPANPEMLLTWIDPTGGSKQRHVCFAPDPVKFTPDPKTARESHPNGFERERERDFSR